MQFFVSDVAWEDNHIISIYRSMIGEDMGDPDGTLIFDESGFVEEGKRFGRCRTAVLRHHRESGELPGRRLCRVRLESTGMVCLAAGSLSLKSGLPMNMPKDA